MNALELLSYLRQHDVQLWVEGDRLRLRAARGELSADLRAQIAEHKAELLALLRAADPSAGAVPAIEPLPRTAPLPLSFAQERLWLIDRIEPGRPIYNVAGVLHLRGPLRVPALAAALGEVVRRHEILRTTFRTVRDEPVQVAASSASFGSVDPPVVDLGGLPVDARERTRAELAAAEARRPFDLELGPVIRTTLLRLEPAEHVLLFSLHHIVSDGWSNGVIIREVGALYAAFSEGRPSPLPALPIQYADFAAWQRRWLRGETLESELAFWRGQLAGAAPVLELPTDRSRPAVQSFRGETRTRRLPARLAAALEALSLAEKATPFMTLLAAFQVLLHRLSGQEDLSVGTAVAGRTRTELEGLIGFFVNTLVLRADLSGDPAFPELLSRVRETALQTFAHQELPFDKLVAELRPERSLSHNPLFQVMFALQNAPRPPLELAGLTLAPEEVESGVARFDLSLALTRTDDGLLAVQRTSSDLFESATAERLLGHLRSLLEGIAADPGRRLSDLPLLSDAERHQLLVEWQGERRAELGEGLLHTAFEEQARRRPRAVAVVFEGETLTYGELDGRADRLARHLRQLGVGPESRVALEMDRRLDLVVALLGVLKAGAAYVPLDPTHPEDRLRWLREDAGAEVLLAELPELPESGEAVVGAATPDNMAYVLYTSGTTGRPKGVMVPHRGVVNHLRWRQAEYGLGASDVLLHKAPLGFDASVWEIFWPLSVGARLVVARPGGHQDVSYLVDLVRREKVTFLHAVPSLLRVLVEEPGLAECASLRWVTTGGEPLPVDVREKFFSVLDAELLHGYGPTEASIGVTYGPCERGSGRATTLGRPIANAEIHLLDRHLGPVPLGVPGELCIGGAGLARGYLGRPDLTAERFVPNPFGDQTDPLDRTDRSDPLGVRLYRSGDLVRRRPDGGLEFLGRIDHQVKVRGMRVEPGEIESVLATHPAVREAVVLPREERAGDKRLVAYVVGSGEAEIAVLRAFLAGKLPPHMVPSDFVSLDSLPLLANGKVDRLALARIELQIAEDEGTSADELDPVQEIVAGIWCEVLGRNRVGRRDSFFDLGGHSLLATQVVSRLRQAFGVELPLRTLFEAPRLDELAARLAAHRRGVVPPPLVPVPRHERMPLSFAQERLWLVEQLDPGRPVYHMPAAVRLEGRLNPAALAASLSEVARRHEALRTRFPAAEGKPAQVIEPAASVPLPVVDLSGLTEASREAESERLAVAEARRPFDLAAGPLLRAALLRRSPEDHLALLTLHHIVSDGWSIGVLIRELSSLYVSSPLPELPVQYADFAAWQRGWLHGEVLEGELGFWRERLAGAPPVLELPGDRLRPAVRSLLGGRAPLHLLAPLGERVASLARRSGATQFMVVLAAFEALLHRLTGQDDLVVGTPVAGRNRIEIEGLIGFFVNTLVLRTALSGGDSWEVVLERVREAALGAYAHQDVPFERIVEELQPERSLSHTPLFQVMLTWQNAPRAALDLPGLRLTPLPVESGTAKFDLSLALGDDGGGGLAGSFQYAADLFDRGSVERLAGCFATLLATVVREPDQPIADLPLLTEAEIGQVLGEGRGERRAEWTGGLLHTAFQEQARRRPGAVALVFEEATLTYRELDEWTDRLARRLRELGVGPESRVALCLDRSFEMVAALLAVLKAGAAYVPLDPTHPADRLRWLFEDSGAEILLADLSSRPDLGIASERTVDPSVAGQGTSVAGQVPTEVRQVTAEPGQGTAEPGQGASVSGQAAAESGQVATESGQVATESGQVASESGQGTSMSGQDTSVLGQPGDVLAYVMYTSGTTGRPKGVMVPHRGVVNHLRWRQAEYGLDESDVLLHKAPLGFDASVWEILWPLSVGARLVLAKPGGHQDIAYLVDLVRREKVTFLHAVPSLLRVLVEEPGLPECASLRWVTTGGEPLPVDVRERFFSVLGAELLHGYGPTEASIGVTYGPCEPGSGRATTLGRPIANAEIYLLDRGLRPMPPGIPGELCIGGVGLARGYLGRPELTAERFVPHPYTDEPGERLYRSGDLVRRRPDGGLEFLGRIDHQIKIRGMRVEPAEIEAVLESHPDVREAVVLLRGDRLIAYVAGRDSGLRVYLAGKLPPHMVPSPIVALDAFPLMASGKVDRLALAHIEPKTAQTEAEDLDPLQEIVAGIWCEVLGVDRVGRRDSFFELGGHSLLATQVVSRLRQTFGIELPLRALFEAPRLDELSARVSEARGASLPPIERVPRTEALPLSFAQERLWFVEQLDPGRPVYHMPAAVRLEGDLDLSALAASLAEIVRRHEVLRTRFPEVDGKPVQRIEPAATVLFPLVDLSGLPEELCEAETARLSMDQARRPFDLAAGPLLRASLLRRSAEDHLALLTLHHIVSDGWSTGVLIRELAALYSGSPLPELPVQYADFSAWQREWLQGETPEAELGWWRERLAGAPPVLELPGDRPRPAVRSLLGGRLALDLPSHLGGEVAALARRRGATQFMVLLAAFDALLHRLTGQEDLVVGTPIAGRNRIETEGLIGFFVNTLVLRATAGAEDPWLNVLERVREAALGAYVHQDVPFERIVEELQPERSLSHSPLFQVMFTMQNAPRSVLELPGLRLTGRPTESGAAKFDLSLALGERDGRLSGSFQYAADLFDRSTVERLAGHLAVLLAGMTADPERPLADLPLLTPTEIHQLLLEGQGERRPGLAEGLLHTAFQEQARRRPRAVAVTFEGESLTYGELGEKASRLARYLRWLGVGPDSRVALCMERSLDLIVALLGTLQAGAAYVPLDPSHPEDRLRWLREDSGAEVLLEALPDLTGAEWSGDAVFDAAAPDNLAYVMYTSGTTGRPKGVMVPHRGVVNHLRWRQAEYGLGESDVLLHKAPLGFDASVWETLWPLSVGARLVVAKPGGHQDIAYLIDLVSREKVTFLHAVPALLRVLVEEPGLSECASLRRVTTGGELLPVDVRERFFSVLQAELLHGYGPTEASIGVTYGPCEPGSGRATTLGLPIANAEIYLLDRRLRPVPLGIPGELCIGGVGLARGYLGRADLTAERFVPHPYSAEPGERLYRSGDLVRRRPDGGLEFLGRIDHQIKIRGMRVEPAEIEAVLEAHPDVREAVVLLRDERLIAYVAGRDSGLRAYLAGKLPPHMVPSAFVALDALPLMASGKIDRLALARIEPQVAQTEMDELDPIQEIVAGIWCEVLRLDRVGRSDSFFDLGGHSLLATQVVSRLRQAFGIELPLRALFEAPRLDELSARVSAARGATLPPIEPVPRTETLPLSFAQERLWFVEQLDPGRPVYHMPAAVRLEGRLARAALEAAVTEIVRRHEVLRTRFPEAEGRPVQRIEPAGSVFFPLVDLSGLPEDRRESETGRLAVGQARRPFDLASGPLLRAALLRRSDEDHLALLTLHHIVSDGWSTGVLIRELAALYSGSPLPELPVQYADFSAWQRSWLQGETLEAELGWWRERLAGAPPVLELPGDRPRPAVRSLLGGRLALDLPPHLGGEVAALARRRGATQFMVLLAAFDALLHRLTGQEDLVVGTPIAGRNRIEIEGLIGFFVNTLVLRAEAGADHPWLDLLERMREAALGAYAHQDVPFERIVEELQPERSLSHSPLFQVMFTMQNAPRSVLELPGLHLTGRPTESGAAKFDLSLALGEREGRLSGSFQYAADLFDRSTVERLAGHLAVLLEGVVSEPERSLADLPLLSPAERHQLLVEGQGERRADWTEGLLHTAFEEQARRRPGHVAVVFEGETLTYGELSDRAGRLARYLRRQGVGPESRVALCLERSLDLVVALLGVLKVGAAYVPLDPSHPEDRLRWLREDSGAEVLLSDLPDLTQESGDAVFDEATPGNLAYVMYTSGTTGRPKGVMVPHRGVVNHLRWRQAEYGLSESDVLVHKAPLGFDASVWEILWPLSVGARLIVAKPGGHQDVAYLVDLVRREKVTFLHAVPSLLRVLVEEPGLAECASLRWVTTGGEPLPIDVREKFFSVLEAELLHGYGPTEASIGVTYGPCEPGSGRATTLGLPIANAEIHLLDRGLRPMPLGVPGELCIGGAGLARGYLGRPDFTAERFMPNPYGAEPGARLYRSGDLVRRRPDGGLEFLGRIDHQIKIRGMRVEPAEIEAVLEAHPDVREAVVLLRDERLIAYVVGHDSDLRAYLAGTLPPHMVPSAFVMLEALPLMASGKVDRLALARIEPQAAREVAEAEELDPIQEIVAGIWGEVLRLDRVGRSDSFFDLGGHSLLATQVVSRLRQAFGIELPLRALFEAPRLDELSARVSEARGATLPPIEPVPRTEVLPLSFAQERLWFVEQLDPGRPIYHMPAAVRLEGRLDRGALAAAVTEIVRRHEVLRTRFPALEGRPVQRIEPAAPVHFPLVDLSGLPEERREAETARLAVGQARRPFDLAAGPLVRASLLRRSAEDHLALLTLHHIVSDGWSTGVLIRELAALYSGSPLPELPVQYADFSAWQRGWLQGEVLEAELGWWRERLAGAPPVLELPGDRPRPAVRSLLGGRQALDLPPHLGAEVAALARRRGATQFMVLLAAFDALLHRLTGQEDLVVGTPIAGRNRIEIEGLIGFFVNTLVLRATAGAESPWLNLLERVREAALGAYAHQDVPFERIVEELQPERSLSHSPLFQVMFTMQNAPRSVLELPGLRLAGRPTESGAAKFDLSLALGERGGRLSGSFQYAADLFDRSTVERFAGHFALLLAGIVSDPERALVDLPLLSDAERHQVLVEGQGERRAEWTEGLLHTAIEEQARRRPRAVAVVFEGQTLTYADLNDQAARLARHLRRQGVGPESRVALLLERSLDLVVALLGVLKAGAAYVPLDPTHPEDRLRWLREDSGAEVLLAGLPDLTQESGGDLFDAATPDNLAYVMYTSGTTGRPKGVMVPHRGVVNHLRWRQAEYGLSESDVLVHKAPLGFDASVWEILWPLSVGARLIVAKPGGHQDVAYLVDLVRREKVTFFHAVPSLLRVLVEEPGLAECASLRWVTTGGEPLPVDVREKFFSVLQAELLHGYGPTEASIGVTYGPCEPGSGRATTLGQPIANAEIYLLDRALSPMPLGVPGELCIGGAGLARGYQGRPDFTAERFVPNPYGTEPGARLYRSGDLVRRRPDGGLEFLGRIDHQIKIRGMRVEPAEIEVVLESHPDVREAVVLLRDERLIAYVAGHDSGLRAYLAGKLPPHMVPSAFVMLEALPLMASGKVDRLALVRIEPQVSREVAEAEELDPIQEMVAGIWCEVLRLDQVGRADSFFELGGHSLLATQVVSRLRQAFGVELPLRTLFEAPRLQELSARISEARGAALPPIERVSRTEALPLSFAQERLWFVEQLDPGRPVYHMPATVRLEGRLDRGALEAAVAEIVRRHEVLRTRFPEADGKPLQRIEPAAPVPFPVVDLAALPADRREAESRRLARAAARRPFDLAAGPMLRATLLRLGGEDHVVLLTMHHIVSDGWSIGVLTRELGVLYGAFSRGLPSPLPELPVQYADFSSWQRGWLQGEVLERELGYWRERLAGAPPVLELPGDRPRPAVRSLLGGRAPLHLPEPLGDGVAALARRHGATQFMLSLAAFAALLQRLTGQEDLVVGTPIAGRNRIEVEGLIGFFVNTLVLRVPAVADDPWTAVLDRVREAALGAYAHQDVPFERVVEELQPERSLSHSPLFQVFFTWQNAPRSVLELPGLRLSGRPTESGTAKFDLSLALGEKGGRLSGVFQYAADLFDHATVERLAGHLAVLLEGVVSDPETPLSDLPLLSPAERHQLLLEGQGERRAELAEGLLHTPFEEQARNRPGHVAVAFEGETLTYGELNDRAERLARHLRRRGVGPDSRVALFLERSLDMVVALLGVLKAGAAYVPLDPTHPEDRLRWMREDSGAEVLLEELPDLTEESGEAVFDEATPDNLAYVMYTSGTTGRPKGVMVPHRGVVNHLRWRQAEYGLGESDVLVHKAPLGFDASVWEILWPLSVGARLIVARPGGHQDVAYLVDLVRREKVTFLHAVPSLLRVLVEEHGLAECTSLRWVTTGGEPLPVDVREKFFSVLGAELLHGYGPTEASIGVTYGPCERGSGRVGSSRVDLQACKLEYSIVSPK